MAKPESRRAPASRHAVPGPGLVAGVIVLQAITAVVTYGVARHQCGQAGAATAMPPATPAPHGAPMIARSGIGPDDVARYLGEPSLPAAVSGDPARLASLAEWSDRHFANRSYADAARGYARLVELAPHNPEIHNNLGLTLHYLGRHREAIERLRAGIATDPSFQRIWLTLGYVHGQAGNAPRAREALERAITLGTATPEGREARSLLDRIAP